MSDFKIGDRVRAKHDHTFEGEVTYTHSPSASVGVRMVKMRTQGQGALYSCPASWLEPVPAPLNPLVPWDVLDEVIETFVYSPSERLDLFAKLREAGYGPAEETR